MPGNYFDQFDNQQRQDPVIAVDPYKQEDQQMQRTASNRAAAADARAAEAAARSGAEWNATHNPDGTPKAKPVQLKPIPTQSVTAIQENRHNIGQLTEALAALQGRPNSVGPGTGILGDTFTQFNDPEGTEVRRIVGQIGAVKIHDLSGAAVSATEAPRFQPFVPTVTDRPEVVRTKLEGFKRELESYLREQQGFYNNPENGYLPYKGPEAEQPSPDAASPKPPAFNPGGALQNADGQIAGNTHDNGDSTGVGIAQGRTRREDNPLLAGVRDEYLKRLARGDSPDSLVAWAKSVGIDSTAEPSIRAQAQFRRENPGVAIGEYDTSQLDDRVINLSDNEISADQIGAGNAYLMNAGDALSGFNYDSIVGATGGNAERARIGMAQVASEHPVASGLGTLTGVTLNALGGEAGLAKAGVTAGLGRTAAANALAGAYEGFGSTDYNSAGGEASFGNRLMGAGQQAGINALASTATTGLINAGRATVAPVTRGAIRTVGGDHNVAVRQVGRALQEDGLTPRAAAARLQDAHARGSPMSLSDVGENTRELAASMGRHRGESRSVVRTIAGNRQEQQLERISSAVRRDLGPTANIRDLGEELMLRAKDESAPLYDDAFKARGAGAVSEKMSAVLRRPSVKRAMVRARRIAEEEGRDPNALGFDLNAQGEVVLTKTPSWETLHYIKTGLDDVIEGYRDKTSGKLVLDAEGRLINNTKNRLLGLMDQYNPVYKEARAAYAGPAAMRDALELGRGALRRSPDDVAANIKNLGPSEMEMYRLGLRKAIVDLIGSKGDYADKVNALIGTPRARSVLKKVLGGEANYERFIATLQDERAMGLTYKAVHGNSATAGRMAFDETTSGENVARHVLDVAQSAKSGGITGAVVRAGEKVAEAGKFGAGSAGDKARADVARLLSESDPEVIAEIARQANRAVAKSRLGRRVASKRAAASGTIGGAIAAALSQGTSPDQ